MDDGDLDSDPPSDTGIRGSRFWWATAAISLFSSTSFVITELSPAPDSLRMLRVFVLFLFILGLVTGILSAIMLMMSGFFVAGTARFRGRKIANQDLAYCFLVCYAVPVIVAAWSVFRSRGVL